MRKGQKIIIGGMLSIFIIGLVILFYLQQQTSSPKAASTSLSTPSSTITQSSSAKQKPSPIPLPKPLNPSITQSKITNAMSANGFVFSKTGTIDNSDPMFAGYEAITLQQASTLATVTMIGSPNGFLKLTLAVPISATTNSDNVLSSLDSLATVVDPESIHWVNTTYQDMMQQVNTAKITVPIAKTITLSFLQYTLEITNPPSSTLLFSIQSPQ